MMQQLDDALGNNFEAIDDCENFQNLKNQIRPTKITRTSSTARDDIFSLDSSLEAGKVETVLDNDRQSDDKSDIE